jgi:small Trp-rich protein
MYFLVAGIGLMVLKFFEIGFVAAWPWWWVLSPFAMAVVWWAWADATGYTKRKAMREMEQKKQNRLERQRAALTVKNKRRP